MQVALSLWVPFLSVITYCHIAAPKDDNGETALAKLTMEIHQHYPK